MRKCLSVALVICLLCTLFAVTIGATTDNEGLLTNNEGLLTNMKITAGEKAGLIEVLNFVDKTKDGTEYEDVVFENVRVGEKSSNM